MSSERGLQQEIGYQNRKRSRMHTAVLRVTGTRASSRLMSKVVSPLDAAISRLTGGKFTATSQLSGLPLITLVTTGARSGERRENLLAAIPCGDDLAVIASNFGQQESPGWVFNLRANPDATVIYGDQTVAVTARPADRDECEQVFIAGAAINPTFTQYRERITARTIPVFILTLPG